jgi:chitin-binding protein
MDFVIGDGSISFTWNADPDHASYTILRDGEEQATQVATTYSQSNLNTDELTTIELQAFSEEGEQRYSWTCTVAPNQYGIVNAEAVALDETTISLSWDSAYGDCIESNQPSFVLYRDGTLLTATADTWFTDTELTSGTEYEYEIRATVLEDVKTPLLLSARTTNPLDVNNDGAVTMTDLNLVADAIRSGDLTKDVNKDGRVDLYDIMRIAREL